VVLKVISSDAKVVVEGVNMVKKHIKPGTVTKEGGIVSIEKPIHISTVMYYNEKEKKSERVGYRKIDGKKFRISKISQEILDKKVVKK
jgi:large subunit ribosomal protein L24